MFCFAQQGCRSWENSNLLARSSPSFCCECSPSESAWTGWALKEGSWRRGEKRPWKDALCWLLWTGRGFSLSGSCGFRPAARALGPSRWQEQNHLEWRGPSWCAQRASQSDDWPELLRLRLGRTAELQKQTAGALLEFLRCAARTLRTILTGESAHWPHTKKRAGRTMKWQTKHRFIFFVTIRRLWWWWWWSLCNIQKDLLRFKTSKIKSLNINFFFLNLR